MLAVTFSPPSLVVNTYQIWHFQINVTVVSLGVGAIGCIHSNEAKGLAGGREGERQAFCDMLQEMMRQH